MSEKFEPKGPLPLFIADFERDTRDIDDDLRMKYLRLLSRLWERGGYIPDDDSTIAELSAIPRTKGWQRKVSTLRSYLRPLSTAARRAEEKAKKTKRIGFSIAFLPDEKDGFLSQAKVILELGKAYSRSQEAQKAGKARAAKAQADAVADADPPDQRTLSPLTQYSKRYSPPPVETSPREAAGDGEGDLVRDVCQRVQSAINSPTPMANVAPAVRRWLEWGCDPDKDILPAIEEAMSRRGEPPGSINYFDKAVKRAMDERLKPPPETANGHDAGAPVASLDSQWDMRVRRYREAGFWLDQWGPKPDQPRCDAPIAALQKHGYAQRSGTDG